MSCPAARTIECRAMILCVRALGHADKSGTMLKVGHGRSRKVVTSHRDPTKIASDRLKTAVDKSRPLDVTVVSRRTL